MPLRLKRWQVAPRVPQTLIEEFHDLNPLLVQVLYNRGVTARPEEVRPFLDGVLDDESPFGLPDMHQAVTTVRRAIQDGERIVVYGDYDADGVTATAVLLQTLGALGAQVQPYIPHREEEGYGLNCEALEELAGEGARLLITVDCGIRSLEEVALARRLGLRVVITDHHHPGAALPTGDAVVNPRRDDCRYAHRNLAGAGVAFKLAQALLRVNSQSPLRTTREELSPDALLDLVALGTIADMVPLLGENHRLVRKGLDAINAARRPGLAMLMQFAGVKPGTVTSRTVSYVLAPRLNAAGRMSDALTALELLMAPDSSSARSLAQLLEKLNCERRELTVRVQEEARQAALAVDPEAPLLFAASRDFPSGIVGLAAGRLSEEFYRPAVVVEVGEEYCRGSARSIPEFHITDALDSMSELFVKYGGHAAAAGFTISADRLEGLRRRLLTLAREQLAHVSLTPVLEVDAEVPLGSLGWPLYHELERMAPFGYGNAPPTLVSRRVRVLSGRRVGVDGRHLKLSVQDEKGRSWNAIAFRQGGWSDRLPRAVDLAYHLERNEWRDTVSLQLNVQDIHPPGEV